MTLHQRQKVFRAVHQLLFESGAESRLDVESGIALICGYLNRFDRLVPICRRRLEPVLECDVHSLPGIRHGEAVKSRHDIEDTGLRPSQLFHRGEAPTPLQGGDGTASEAAVATGCGLIILTSPGYRFVPSPLPSRGCAQFPKEVARVGTP